MPRKKSGTAPGGEKQSPPKNKPAQAAKPTQAPKPGQSEKKNPKPQNLPKPKPAQKENPKSDVPVPIEAKGKQKAAQPKTGGDKGQQKGKQPKGGKKGQEAAPQASKEKVAQKGKKGKGAQQKAQTQVKSDKQAKRKRKGSEKKRGQTGSSKKRRGSKKKRGTERRKGSQKKGSQKKKRARTETRTKTPKRPSTKKKKGADGKKKKQKFRLRNTRQQGRQTGNEKLWEKLRPTEDDVLKMLAAQVHIGPARSHANMQRYVFKRRKDGLHVINLDKTWHKMVLAARILAAIQNPADIMVMSTRTYGQRGAIKFAHYTGATPMVGKWIPGTFCNPQNKAYAEPRLLLVDDPATCFAALRETSYVGIPVIALCGVNNNTRFVDCAVPCNNRGKLSLGLMFWLLAREMLRMKKEIPRDKPWDAAPVDLFFYRDPDKIKKAQEEKAKKQEQQEYGAQAAEYYDNQYGAGDTYPPAGADFGIEQLQTWDQEPPQHVLEDWAAADVMMDATYQEYGDELQAVEPYERPEDAGQYYGTTEEQAFGTVHMQEW